MTHPIFWPLLTAAVASRTAATFLADLAGAAASDGAADDAPPVWTTPSSIALELQTMSLRDFSLRAAGPPLLLCAPFAIHRANITDFAPGHSIVERLRGAGVSRLFVTDWRSAVREMRYLSIDSYLADLHVAIDSLGPPVDLVGLCQGGWLAALYAARFPHNVRRLGLVGAPIDLQAEPSQLAEWTATTPAAVYQGLVDAGGGLVPGKALLDRWTPPREKELRQVLQYGDAPLAPGLSERFAAWWQQTFTLPGAYYLQVVEQVFRENRIARGEFTALGHKVSLSQIRCPLFLLAGADDELIAPNQLLAARRLVGTEPSDIVSVLEPGGHLTLFIGRRLLERRWTEIGRWLAAEEAGHVSVVPAQADR